MGTKKAAAMIEVENFMILIMLPTMKYVSFVDVLFVVILAYDVQRKHRKLCEDLCPLVVS